MQNTAINHKSLEFGQRPAVFRTINLFFLFVQLLILATSCARVIRNSLGVHVWRHFFRYREFTIERFAMIRTNQATELGGLVNSQPWSKQQATRTPSANTSRQPVGKSKSVNGVFDRVRDAVSEVKEHHYGLRSSISVKSDTECVSPLKQQVRIFPKFSPVSVVDSDQGTGNESTSKDKRSSSMSDCEDGVPSQAKVREAGRINNNSFGPSILQHSFGEEDFNRSPKARKIVSMLGSIPTSFRISSSNFSTRSDITAPTIFEPPSSDGRLSPTAMNPSDASREVRSIDCAPLQPRRRGSNDGEYIAVVRKKSDIPCHVQCHRNDSCPTKPSRRSSINGPIPGTDLKTISFRTALSTDLSPTKPRRQKSVSSLFSRGDDARTSVSSLTLRSNPPCKPQREMSLRSLGSSGSCFELRKDRLPMQESILEEPMTDEV